MTLGIPHIQKSRKESSSNQRNPAFWHRIRSARNLWHCRLLTSPEAACRSYGLAQGCQMKKVVPCHIYHIPSICHGENMGGQKVVAWSSNPVNVNHGLINPKRLLNWGDSFSVSDYDYFHRIGWWENSQENRIFDGTVKTMLSCRFPLNQSIDIWKVPP